MKLRLDRLDRFSVPLYTLSQNTLGTGAFLDKVAEVNGLEVQAQLVERDDILQQGVLHTGHNLSTSPMSLPDDQPPFKTNFDVEL